MKQLLMAITLLLLWAFLYNYAEAKELPKEMSMITEAGEIVLTSEECIFKKQGLQGYDYAAYATDKGHPNHEGCWKSDSYEGKHAVYIYFPEINQTAVFDAKLFQPKANI
jgi:hypothetical protein